MLMGFRPTGGKVLKEFQAVGFPGCSYCGFWLCRACIGFAMMVVGDLDRNGEKFFYCSGFLWKRRCG